jgi:hypothetical protein
MRRGIQAAPSKDPQARAASALLGLIGARSVELLLLVLRDSVATVGVRKSG